MEHRKENKNDKFNLVYPLSLVTQIGVTVAVTAGFFILSGKFLDDYFHTSPVLLLLGALIAFIASMYAVYRLVLPITSEDKKEDK